MERAVTQVSYADLFGIVHEERDEPLGEGDLVITGACDHPRYRIVAIQGDRAWIRSENGADYVVRIDRCKRVEE